MKTKRLKIALLIAMLIMLATVQVFAAPNVTVKINGQALTFPDQKPYINSDNRTMVPVRAPMEAIGCKVDWNDQTRQATITKGDKTAVFTIGSMNYTVNGATKTMDTKAVITGSRTAFPIRFAAEAMGASVGWDAQNYIVNITTGTQAVQTVEFKTSDPKCKEVIVKVAGYELAIGNGEGGKGSWAYVNSNNGVYIKVVCTNRPEWNEYNAPCWDGSYGMVRTDYWRPGYSLYANDVSPLPKPGDKAILDVYGKVNGQEVKIAEVIRNF